LFISKLAGAILLWLKYVDFTYLGMNFHICSHPIDEQEQVEVDKRPLAMSGKNAKVI